MTEKPRKTVDLTGEPNLRELLEDPILWLVMARDGVRGGDILAMIDRVRRDRGMTEAWPSPEWQKGLAA